MKNNDDTVQELLQLQKKLESAKQEKARMEGELKSLLKRLVDDFGTDKISEVEKRLAGMKQQAERLRQQIETGLAVLRKETGE